MIVARKTTEMMDEKYFSTGRHVKQTVYKACMRMGIVYAVNMEKSAEERNEANLIYWICNVKLHGKLNTNEVKKKIFFK